MSSAETAAGLCCVEYDGGVPTLWTPPNQILFRPSEIAFVETLPELEGGPDLSLYIPKLEHQFDVTPEVQAESDRLYATAIQDPAVRRLHKLVEDIDPDVRQHLLRTGRGAAVLGVAMGMSAEEIVHAIRIELMDDTGKTHPDVQSALRSPRKFEQDDTLFPRIQRHSWIGVLSTLR